MTLFYKIVAIVIVIIGSFIIFGGLGSSDNSSPWQSLSVVMGGGFFMFLGMSILFLNKRDN